MKAMKFILVFLSTALLGALLYLSWNDPYYHMPFMMHGSGWLFFGGFFFVVVILVIGGLYILQSQTQQSTSLDHLKHRLAKGKITVEEYNEIKRTIIGG